MTMRIPMEPSYDRLTLIEEVVPDDHGRRRWRCRCTCGTIVVVLESNLKRHLTRSCGCLRTEISRSTAREISRKFAYKRRKTNLITREGRTAFIHLPGGSVAMISARDVDLVRGFRWELRGGPKGQYVRSSTKIYLHRLIMGVVDTPSVEVDHKDHNPLNCRRSNLRKCDHGTNLQNSSRCAGASGYRGVYQRGNRFVARINVSGHPIELGRFDTAEDGALAYNRAARKYYGTGAFQNEVRNYDEAAWRGVSNANQWP